MAAPAQCAVCCQPISCHRGGMRDGPSAAQHPRADTGNQFLEALVDPGYGQLEIRLWPAAAAVTSWLVVAGLMSMSALRAAAARRVMSDTGRGPVRRGRARPAVRLPAGAEVGSDGDGPYGIGITRATGGGDALRQPARRFLCQAGPARLVASALVRGVAGAWHLDAGPRARFRPDHRHRRIRSQRERDVRGQRSVPARQLDHRLVPVAAAPRSCDDLPAHRRYRHTRVPSGHTRYLRAGLPDRDMGTHYRRGHDSYGMDECTRASRRG